MGCSSLTPDLDNRELIFPRRCQAQRNNQFQSKYMQLLLCGKENSYLTPPACNGPMCRPGRLTVGNGHWLPRSTASTPSHLHPPSRAGTSRRRRPARWAGPGRPARGPSGVCRPGRKFRFWGYLCSSPSSKGSWRRTAEGEESGRERARKIYLRKHLDRRRHRGREITERLERVEGC